MVGMSQLADEDLDDDPRPRQRASRDDSDQNEEYESEEAMDIDGQVETSADDQLAKKLVRYAISCEYSRTPIRRDGIKERGKGRSIWELGVNADTVQVLGNQGRSFKRILALAQKQLKHVWGMELRELPVREKMSLHEKRQGTAYQTRM
jgi:hypothetical protein